MTTDLSIDLSIDIIMIIYDYIGNCFKCRKLLKDYYIVEGKLNGTGKIYCYNCGSGLTLTGYFIFYCRKDRFENYFIKHSFYYKCCY